MKNFEGIDPEIKKEINEEGFEDDAAVLIGKKEEMPQLLEKLEKEGRSENLGSYIKMHKEVVLPKEEMSEWLKKAVKPGLEFHFDRDYKYGLFYVDRDHNIASVSNFNPDNVASLKGEINIHDQIAKELRDLGFENAWRNAGQDEAESDYETETGIKGVSILKSINEGIASYHKKIREQIKQKRQKEFDF